MADSDSKFNQAVSPFDPSVTLPLDATSPAVPRYDPVIGEQAFAGLKDRLLAMPESAVLAPNADPGVTGVVAFALLSAAREPGRSETFLRIPADMFPPDTLGLLNGAAWTLWFLQSRVQSLTATAQASRVSVEVLDNATKTRGRMIKVLDYHLSDNALMQAELADIRSGQGFQDLASDLTRLAAHYTAHKTTIQIDAKHYDPADETLARGIANEIYVSLQPADQHAVVDLRNRAWTLVLETYNTIKAAADFIYRAQPRVLAQFPAMRPTVLAITAKRRPAEEPVVEPVVEQPVPVTPTVAGTSTPVKAGGSPTGGTPGLPGGDPIVD